MDALSFRRACGQFATGIVIATAVGADGQPHGMTVNSFTSVSLDPPLVLICVDKSTPLRAVFEQSGRYGLSVLAQDQRELSQRFAQRGHDRFQGVAWFPGSTGVPLLNGALSHLECEIRNVFDAGDHVVLLGEAVRVEFHGGLPLLYFASGYREIA